MSSLRIPVLLLKTKSTPHDSYEEYLSSPTSSFTSLFVPVLEHKPNTSSLEHVKILLRDGELKRKYGGMIFTSQRAVEGFAQVVQELEGESILAKGAEENGSVEYTDRRLESSMTCPNACPVVSFVCMSTDLVIFFSLLPSRCSIHFLTCLSISSIISNPS